MQSPRTALALLAVLAALAAPAWGQDGTAPETLDDPPQQPEPAEGDAPRQPDEPSEDEPSEDEPGTPPNVDRLLADLVARLDELRTRALQQGVWANEATTAEDAKAAREALAELDTEIATVERKIDEIVTGIGLHGLDAGDEEKLDLKDELLQLTAPLVEEIKGLTEAPRRISALRKQVDLYTARLVEIDRALERIDAFQAEGDPSLELESQLARLRHGWIAQRDAAAAERDRAELQLHQIEADRPSIVVASQQAVRNFFRSRGRNVVLAVAAFVLVLLVLTRSHGLIQKFSPLHRRLPRPFYVRLVDVVLVAFTVFASFSAALTTLYVLGDWTLLSLSVLFLFGLTWAAKQGLPQIWQQVRTVLNIGSVREGERLVLEGVPWQVKSLGFTTVLVNPAFGDLSLRLPVHAIMDMQSRPGFADEPWFPCNTGDWVLLGDGVHGCVAHQSHEMVQLALPGGATKTYVTGDFLGQSPMNLAQGFRVDTTFGVGYGHQAQIAEIPEALAVSLRAGFAAQGLADALKGLVVELDEAAGSSLNLKIIADFDGSVAPARGRVQRLLQSLTVDACNQHGWDIPFPQLTVHQP